MLPSRRSVLHAFLSAPAASLLASASAGAQPVPAPLTRTPACDGLEPTPPATEGPFYKPGTPERRSFAEDVPGGEPITLAGFVLDEQCRPQAGALVELWHADDEGRYDNAGYRLRGHQFTDEGGRWWFSTIVPALYTGRTRHYHVKVQRRGGDVLTTQLYFPGEARNARDRLFDERLLMRVEKTADGKFARYDFVV
ncbi:intradiol ring-cleavage dioxygenase [Chelatococcus daeguensis]|uniref:dioxygenase family protein n=1 Tax=Chelatococcus daeguensis TaxID=444444 RepID=UPI0007AC2491|nr:intradiol ring-cleavage dioxygenase [Chelatococcus daeguensis]KZE29343.1 intradiol ring-cleavage dioxygenase [Chelatococcus daeguensis]MBM3084079.1 intradiol ring-cleavage dioxygenase [Chelatococcus daeguensis]